MKKIIFMILSINTILLGNEIHLSSTTITTTSGLNTPLIETNKNITLITKEDISKKQYNNVEAILRDTPNIIITNTQFGPTINLRGSGERSMSRVKVMIDGINLTPLEESMGSLPLNSIPVSSIEKIEIIPGGGAALYGSGTTGGVINIITLADSRKDFISADLKGGSYYNKNLDFSIGQNINDNLYLSLATQYSNKDGYRENENSENKSFNGTLDYIINEKHRIKFQGLYFNDEGKTSTEIKKSLLSQNRRAKGENIDFDSKRGSFSLDYEYRASNSLTLYSNIFKTKYERNFLQNDTRDFSIPKFTSNMPFSPLIKNLKCIGILILSDVIRQDAKTTLDYFKRQDVDIKIISGDDPVTVSAIARRCHLLNYEHYIDVSSLSDEQIKEAIEKYTIFGRVSPKQKQLMVNALQENNHTVAMTGDGVNDVLALKAADCSIAMASGSDAAKSASHIVLLKNNFNAMPHIVNEGRRVINNITASASMYLIKTIFSVVLSIGMILFGHGYPFKPIQLTVISACCVGIPTFFLTYEPNFKRVSGDFLKTVFKNAFPFAFMIAICSTIIVNGGRVLGLEKEMLSTICVLLTSWCYYSGLRHIYAPLSHYRIFVIYIMQIVLYISLIVGHQFLGLGNIDYIGAITLMFLVTFSKVIYLFNFELFDYVYLFLQKRYK